MLAHTVIAGDRCKHDATTTFYWEGVHEPYIVAGKLNCQRHSSRGLVEGILNAPRRLPYDPTESLRSKTRRRPERDERNNTKMIAHRIKNLNFSQ